MRELEFALMASERSNWSYTYRQFEESHFEGSVYTIEKFLHDARDFVEEQERVRLNADIEKKLLGKLDHEFFCGKGREVKEVLLDNKRKLVKLDNDLLELD